MKTSHLKKVTAHAEKRLTAAEKKHPSERLSVYKSFLNVERHRVRLAHQAGGGGRQIAAQKAAVLDVVISHLFHNACQNCTTSSKAPQPLALCALGGYGRGELNPFSDVDIMFLYDGVSNKVSAYVNEVVEQVLYMLWDIGFKVGHSTRSIKEAIKQANQDMLSKTSLLESRIVIGEQQLFDSFQEAFLAKCVLGREDEYIRWRVEDQRARHAKYGNAVCLQEPNIKNGCGGLRDYQNLLWVTYFKEQLRDTSSLVEKKLLTAGQGRRLERAYDFLLRVRTDLHYLNGRSADSLTLYFQGQIASRFDYPGADIAKKSEVFMREYFKHARDIYLISATVFDRLSLSPTKTAGLNVFNFLARQRPQEEQFDGFKSRDGLLYPAGRSVFKKDPHRLMRVFQHAQQRQLSFSPELKQVVRHSGAFVNRTFQYSRAARETFEAILSRKGQVGRILRLMHEMDFLGRYVPEFGQLTCLVQHEFFHRYTADEHTLVCIETLDSLIDTEVAKLQGYREIFEKLEDPYALYLALLLHDTGKASDAPHHAEASTIFAQKVGSRLQLTPERRRKLIFLVDHHMTLSSTAQRRNIEDPTTIEAFAEVVSSQENLDALMLLTLSDGQATSGDKSWSDWKESLVWRLYRATGSYLADGEAYYRQRKEEINRMFAEVRERLPESYEDELTTHFASMPETYFHVFNSEDIVEHVRIFGEFLKKLREDNPDEVLSPIIKWKAKKEQGHSEVLVCTWDREGLLGRIAGSLAAARINILSADIYTRSDNVVLDVFRVCNTNFEAVTNQRDIDLVGRTLHESLLTEDFDIRPLLGKRRRFKREDLEDEFEFPTRIVIDNDAHPTCTVVEIQSADRLGFLYDLLQRLSAEHINITSSRIETEKGAAIDTFYVTGPDGRKITRKKKLAKLQRAIQKAIKRATVETV